MAEPNIRFRAQMEDEHIIIDQFGGDNQSYIAVYDGHGGRKTVDFVKEHLHKNFMDELSTNKDDVNLAFEKSYYKTDQAIKDTNELSGSTAATAFIRMEDDKKMLYTANAGDARIVLNRNGTALRMTTDHKATDPEEIKRIEERQGAVFMKKVGGTLAVTRAFGDSELKKYVTADPYQKNVELNSDDTHLVIACDGLWDVMEDQEVVDFIQERKDQTAQQLAEALVKQAIEKRSRDNISVIVISF